MTKPAQTKSGQQPRGWGIKCKESERVLCLVFQDLEYKPQELREADVVGADVVYLLGRKATSDDTYKEYMKQMASTGRKLEQSFVKARIRAGYVPNRPRVIYCPHQNLEVPPIRSQLFMVDKDASRPPRNPRLENNFGIPPLDISHIMNRAASGMMKNESGRIIWPNNYKGILECLAQEKDAEVARRKELQKKLVRTAPTEPEEVREREQLSVEERLARLESVVSSMGRTVRHLGLYNTPIGASPR